MKYLTIYLVIITLLIATCTPLPASRPVDLPPDTAVTNPPEDSMPPLDSEETQFAPQPGDAKLTHGNVYINKTELLIRESYPPQISLGISGDLPTPCHQLRVKINEPDSENKISADVYSVADSNRACIQVLEPFQESIDLGTFPSSHYTVWLNGNMVGEFDS